MNFSIEGVLGKLKNKNFYNIEVVDKVSSTNDVLKQKALLGCKEGETLIALSQTKGKGRLGRVFYSPQRTGLYMSIILRPDLMAQDAVLITTAAAVAIAKATEEISGRKAQIKWVNDIYIEGKKVCGILVEAGINQKEQKLDYAVLGIGINVYAPCGGFPEEIKDIADAVFPLPENDIRNVLCARVLDNFYEFYKNLSDKSFVEEYISRSCVVGKNIKVILNCGEKDAVCTGIDERCRLRVQYNDGSEELLSSGEISIKVQ